MGLGLFGGQFERILLCLGKHSMCIYVIHYIWLFAMLKSGLMSCICIGRTWLVVLITFLLFSIMICFMSIEIEKVFCRCTRLSEMLFGK